MLFNSFYESIDQQLLVEKLYTCIEHKGLRRYLYQIIHRTVEYGGNYREITQGISRDCFLSPIFGALYLKVLDELFTKFNGYYIRYMDDILIMTKTRWQNRKAIKLMNECFSQLKVEQHPDKTFIGRIEKGFDFLGYHFSREPLHVANITIKKHAERIIRLYEQQKTKKATSEEMALVLGLYVKRWRRWCGAKCSFYALSLYRRGVCF
ncbi:reverse transcriptase domain-containing protein [Nitrosomonas sp. Nm84]|uniref:reverse transcriptase domain-containing protein n=1 Tax=Nitrosomonas sp. Nm84 TaxID=200124 RepID=UPI000D769EBF|nr:reverse transcriptase domain-containing protein [Nitrosomonas sp. Nm84]